MKGFLCEAATPRVIHAARPLIRGRYEPSQSPSAPFFPAPPRTAYRLIQPRVGAKFPADNPRRLFCQYVPLFRRVVALRRAPSQRHCRLFFYYRVAQGPALIRSPRDRRKPSAALIASFFIIESSGQLGWHHATAVSAGSTNRRTVRTSLRLLRQVPRIHRARASATPPSSSRECCGIIAARH